MEVIVLESQAFHALIAKIESAARQAANSTDPNRWITIEEAAEYTGFSTKWIQDRAEQIGRFQDGKGLRFRIKDIDAYMSKHFIQKK